MNKFLLLLIVPLLSFCLMGCEDDKETKPMDLSLLADTWEVVDQGNQEVFEKDCIIDVTVSPDQTDGAYGGYHGFITTYYLSADGTPAHDKVYGWSIREVENHNPLLDMVFKGDLDSDNPWEGQYFYKITKLTYADMWWQVNTNGDNSTIKFRRRTDLRAD